jgi:exosome complex RNA-binding protein Csl4
MLRKRKIFMLVVLIFFISTLTVLAVQNSKEIKVFYRDIKIFVNNNEIALENEPFLYNDRVYIPIGFVSKALNFPISWDSEKNTVSILTLKDFKESDPSEDERFVYGEILSLDRDKRTVFIYQHIDDNTIYEEADIKIAKDVIIVLQRNNKKINLSFEDLKIGDIVGMVINKDNEVRGMIVDS